MDEILKLTKWQRYKARLHFFRVGVSRRLTVGVRAVLLEGRKVLLVRQTYLPGWHFPGGGVEPGETAEMAGARETMEETGYATDGRPTLHGFFLNRMAGGARDHVAVYVWREFRGQHEFKPNIEIAECGWFDVEALPDDVEPGTARRLREIFDRTKPAAEW
jgi:ADP-ribose pyrophosphatase YjhB (NUDIX family)